MPKSERTSIIPASSKSTAPGSQVKIKHVEWRNGRPRFKPGPGLREKGYKPKDLKHPDDRWFTQGEAIDWSNEFSRLHKEVEAVARMAPKKPVIIIEPPKPRGFYPVSKLFEEWLASPRVLSKRTNTIRDYKQKARVIENHDPDLWASDVRSLDQPTCYSLYEELWEERGVSTARGALTVLGMAIKWAMKRGKVRGLTMNPARDLEMQTPDPRARFIKPAEFDVLVWAAENKMQRIDLADMLYCGVWTGQRQSDRLGMLKSAFRNGRFVVRQDKTNAIISPPVSKQYQARLDAADRRRKAAGKTSDYAHLNESTWEQWNGYTYRQLFRKVRVEAAKKMPSCATIMEKDLRATAVTWLALAGCTIPQICAITGHSLKTATEILKHYLALQPEMAATAIGSLVEWYEAGASIEMAAV
jgi:hypothetical protein